LFPSLFIFTFINLKTKYNRIMKKNYNLRHVLRQTKYIKTMCFLAATFCVALPNILLSQQSYTFTNAGATGRLGPTQAQLNAAYLSTNLNGLVTTGNGIQSFTIPAGGLYHIEAWGASGGSALYSGYGAKVVADINFTAGTVLQILVGQMGSSYATSNSDGGGGGSFVVANGSLVVAAGGGGGSAQQTVVGKDAQLTNAVVNGSQSQFGSSGAGYTVNGVHFNYSIYTTVAQSFTNGGNGQAGGQAGGWPGGSYGEGGFGGGG
jgi:hypothetical protein